TFQCVPWSVVLRTLPPMIPVAAYTLPGFCGSAASLLMGASRTKPEFTAVQVVPPPVVLKIPLSSPTYMLPNGSITRAETGPIERLVLSHVSPPSVLLKNPLSLPAYTVCESCG